jgi:hypothetical protein
MSDKFFGHEPHPSWRDSDDEILQSIYWRERCYLAERLLKHVFTNQEIGRAHHIADIEAKLKLLKEQITDLRETAECRNKQLAATNIIACCTGGCLTGIIGDPYKVTEELVVEVERIAERLRSWFANRQSRLRNGFDG